MILASGFSDTVTDGSLVPAAGVAALVGLIGFLSPCVLPLVPGYLSYVAGLSGSERESRPRRVIVGALLFVLGFTAVFVAEGALFGSFGELLRDHTVTVERIFGAVTILLGLVFLGQIPWLQREFRIHRLPPAGLVGAPLLGIAFGVGWTPCLTPTLGSVIGVAYSESTAGRGAVLMIFYCLGLGVPFLLVAAGVGWVSGAIGFVRQHGRVVARVGGVLLIVIGVLLVSGAWDHWMIQLRDVFNRHPGVGANL
ncbi:MAG TPA: cytochrome c biogenesis CcdA family protein [Jatrophihabitantaceae bacterium]|jgi:cytochrome c-type biogenesis protein